MKLILLSTCLPFCALPLSQAADLFAPPPNARATEAVKYPTSAAILAATRSGEILELFTGSPHQNEMDALGRSVLNILRDEYRVPTKNLNVSVFGIGLLLFNIAKYELGAQKNQQMAATFQHNRKMLEEAGKNPKLMEALDLFLKDYARAVRESIYLKQGIRLSPEAEKQRQADRVEQKAQDERRQAMAVADAQEASIRAEEERRAAVTRTAMQAQEKAKDQKLQEVLASPAYKIWQVSLQIEEGLRMVEQGKQILAKDDAIERESGVTDKLMRRTAGERIVAGKTLVEQAFATYQQLGGKARKPEDIKAGTDPARDYR